jgi:predicted HD phosphohydrolase
MIQTVDELFDVLVSCDGFFDSLGDDGDPIPILDHGLQCAAILSRVAPDDEELAVAGLVHDIGHRLLPEHSREHGVVAADAVRQLLGERVAALVELHVPAKRYLVTTDPSYADGLSHGSTVSLAYQGGVLTDDERAALETRPELRDALTLRRADEGAKVIGATVPGLEHWRAMVERVAYT